MKKFSIRNILFISLSLITNDILGAGFFANKSIQNSFQGSFALNSYSSKFVNIVSKKSLEQADLLVEKLQENQNVYNSLLNFKKLTIDEQIDVLKKVFKIEVAALDIREPELIIDKNYKKGAYFEFNLNDDLPGKVFINPTKLVGLESLALIIHETKHSYQLQLAKMKNNSILGFAYKNAFKAQLALKGKLGFCDFLTLNNEYEAFMFGNYVIHKLFEGRESLLGMGTYASQFNKDGSFKINLQFLHEKHSGHVIEKFNYLEKEQEKILKKL